MSSDALVVAQQLRQNIARLRRTLRAQQAVSEIPRNQEAALSWLHRKGALSIADLARWEQVRPQSMGAVVAELLKDDLVRKDPDPTDGRRELVSLTPAGIEAHRGTTQTRDRELAELMRHQLTDDEREIVARAMTLLERLNPETLNAQTPDQDTL